MPQSIKQPSRESARQSAWRDKLEEMAKKYTKGHLGPLYKRAGLHPSNATRHFDKENPTKITQPTFEKILDAWQEEFDTQAGASLNGSASVKGDLAPAPEMPCPDSGGGLESYVLASAAIEGAGYNVGDILFIDRGATPDDGDPILVDVLGKEQVRLFREPYWALTAMRDPRRDKKPEQIDQDRVRLLGTVVDMRRSKRPLSR